MYQSKFMERALQLSGQALKEAGTEPFGAVIVKNGEIVGEGRNQSWTKFDPTSHGEIEAIRDACRSLKTVDLSDCEIYTSCEPCPLCVAAITMTGIAAMYYAASLDDAGNLLKDVRNGDHPANDICYLRRETGSSIAQRAVPVRQAMSAEAGEILKAWVKRKNKAAEC